jgi:hypothetical protein
MEAQSDLSKIKKVLLHSKNIKDIWWWFRKSLVLNFHREDTFGVRKQGAEKNN